MIKLFWIFLGIITWAGGLYAQGVKLNISPDKEKQTHLLDSLEQQLSITPDSLQLELLNEVSDLLEDFPRKDSIAMLKGLEYSQKAEKLTKELGDTTAWISSLKPLIYFYKRQKGQEEKVEELEDLRRSLRASLGYTIPNSYHNWIGNKESSLDSRLWAYYDSTTTLRIEDVKELTLKPLRLGDRDLNDMPGNWWIQVRIRSNAEHWEEHVFYTGGKQNFWDTVEVFVAQADGRFEKHLTGKTVDPDEWVVPDRANHFRISIPPKGDMKVYMKVNGFSPGFAPDRIRLRHINYEAFLRERVKTRHANGIFQGIVLIQLFFFLLLYLATRDHIYGNYIIYILGLCVFILNVNYFERVDELVRMSLFLLAIWLSTVGMLLFSHAYLNMKELMPKWRIPLIIFLILFTASSLVIGFTFPFLKNGTDGLGFVLTFVFGISVLLYFLLTIAAIVFLPIWGIRTLRKGYKPAKYYLIATLFLFVGFLLPLGVSPFQDSLSEMGFFKHFSMSSLIEGGIALQLCLFALGVGHKRNLLEKERREALENNLAMQKEINVATDRFVPYEFLKTLGRESILDVNLGDQVEKHVTVFFSDIRDYTSLSENLTPQQNFLFLNNYLGRVGPIIKTNRGFVNQYYGDGMMALFMDADSGINSPKDSVLASFEMHKEVFQYNQGRIEKGREPIRIGIGIHTGALMLGVIGDEKRMDVGVVSDAVNTAARMEGLTKHYGATTIVSGATFDGMIDTDGLHYRFLGLVQVKGKQEPIKIYDFFDGDPEDIGMKKEESLLSFQQGLSAYFDKDFKAAEQAFLESMQVFPEDKASQTYLLKAQTYLQSGVPENWTGVEIIGRK